MVTRKGLGKGLGKGYKNLKPTFMHDKKVHATSAKGIRQPQRMSPMLKLARRRAVSKLRKGLRRGLTLCTIHQVYYDSNQGAWRCPMCEQEHRQAIVQAMKKRKGGKWQYGDRDLHPNPKSLEEQKIAKFRMLARRKDIDPVLFEEFMMRAFPDATGGYDEEWADRFKKGNPMKYMDSNTLRIYKEVIKDYEEKYFHRRGGKNGNYAWSKDFGGKMSKKDYEAFAKIFGTAKSDEELKSRMLDYMEQDNPLFDRTRFAKRRIEWESKGGKRIRKGKHFFQGDRVSQGNWGEKRWAKARHKDNAQIGRHYEDWEKSKYQRWK